MTGVPLRRSIRVRLPLAISLVIVIVLGAFLYAVNRALDRTLLQAGEARAQAAAAQLATLMAGNTARGANEARRRAGTDAVLQYLRGPSPDRAEQARAALAPLAVAGQPPVVLVDAGGRTLIEIPAPDGKATAAPPSTWSAHSALTGLTPFRNVKGVIWYDFVVPVGAEPLGAVIVRRTLSTAQTTETINRLVGGGAFIAIGNQKGDVWSDFSQPVAAPPVDASRTATAEYRRPDGDRRLGASALIGGTPWTVWVEFPRDRLLEPARAMVGRMVALSLLFAALAAAGVAVVTIRMTRPLHELTAASAAIAGGQFSRRVRATRTDEIGRLASAFNTMTAHVERAHQELEQRVEERTRSLHAAMQELEAFSYSVSHDLRAPLRHLAGFASLLEQSAPGLDDRSRRYVKTIVEAATRMGRLIDDLLAFSRVGRTEISVGPVALADLVRDVQREVVNGAAPERIVWRTGELPVVAGDRALLRLVFVNLLSNAVKYSSTRERSEIDIGEAPSTDPRESVVFVRDNGVGFDMAYAHKLFGVFQRLHAADEFEGTGIGLANVRRIVQRHGGRVWAESEPGAGATFFVSLPREATTT